MSNGSKSGPRKGQYSKERMEAYRRGWDMLDRQDKKAQEPEPPKGWDLDFLILALSWVFTIALMVGFGWVIVEFLMAGFPVEPPPE